MLCTWRHSFNKTSIKVLSFNSTLVLQPDWLRSGQSGIKSLHCTCLLDSNSTSTCMKASIRPYIFSNISPILQSDLNESSQEARLFPCWHTGQHLEFPSLVSKFLGVKKLILLGVTLRVNKKIDWLFNLLRVKITSVGKVSKYKECIFTLQRVNFQSF